METMVVCPLLLVLLSASGSGFALPPIISSQPRLTSHQLKPWTNCTERPLGFSGVKAQFCKTIWQYSLTKPPIVTCRIGKVDPGAVDKIQQAYGGILKSSKQHSSHRGQPEHDSDMCCPTTRSLQQAPSWMENTYGNVRDIFNLAAYGLYQYYHSGRCVKSSEQINCKGTCIEEKSMVYLLVIRDDLDTGISFEPFEVPSYCSCKNLGRTESRVTTSSFNGSRLVGPPSTARPTGFPAVRQAINIIPGQIRVYRGQVIHSSLLTQPPRLPRPRYPAPSSSLSPNKTQNVIKTATNVTASVNSTVESNITMNATVT